MPDHQSVNQVECRMKAQNRSMANKMWQEGKTPAYLSVVSLNSEGLRSRHVSPWSGPMARSAPPRSD